MDFSSPNTQIIAAVVLVGLSYILTRLMIARVRIMDDPNERSSHAVATPRSGGIAIVTTFFIGVVALALLASDMIAAEQMFWPLVGAAGLIAVVSILDDVLELGFKAKLATQVLCAVIVMGFGIVLQDLNVPGIGDVPLGVWGYVLTLFWIVGLTNAFNFMDGIDGISGSTAVIAAINFGVIALLGGGTLMALVCALIVFSTLGFLWLNWTPAKIFMGDAGSQFLGFVLAVMAVMGANLEQAHTSFFVMPLLFLHYIWDTAFTFFRRLKNGERVTQAHRTHLYQLMNQLGLSHVQVTTVYAALSILQGLAAWVVVRSEGTLAACAIAPFLVLYAIATLVIYRRARASGLVA